MALIKCPECEKAVSDKAQTCIHCGYPLAEAIQQKETPIDSIAINTEILNEINKNNALGDELRANKRYIEALEYYEKAADLDSSHAQVWIGNIYARGLGVEKNSTKAATWYQKAVAQNDPSALTNLGFLYANGDGVEKDYNKAIELYSKAIALGDATAAGNLGMLYEFAPENIRSYTLAVQYYERAVALGTNNHSVYGNLASLYDFGRGTPSDYNKAFQYYTKAVSLGSNSGSIYNNLAMLYENGQGVKANYAKAEEYYLKAIEIGNTTAKNNYDLLRKSQQNESSKQQCAMNAIKKHKAYKNAIYFCLLFSGLFAVYMITAGPYILYVSLFLLIVAGILYCVMPKDIREVENELNEQKRQQEQEYRERLTRTCPRCGRHSGHPIDENEKKRSIMFWGYASNKWGKSYKCDSCDYMW